MKKPGKRKKAKTVTVTGWAIVSRHSELALMYSFERYWAIEHMKKLLKEEGFTDLCVLKLTGKMRVK